jgi:hypothetical protein
MSRASKELRRLASPALAFRLNQLVGHRDRSPFPAQLPRRPVQAEFQSALLEDPERVRGSANFRVGSGTEILCTLGTSGLMRIAAFELRSQACQLRTFTNHFEAEQNLGLRSSIVVRLAYNMGRACSNVLLHGVRARQRWKGSKLLRFSDGLTSTEDNIPPRLQTYRPHSFRQAQLRSEQKKLERRSRDESTGSRA